MRCMHYQRVSRRVLSSIGLKIERREARFESEFKRCVEARKEESNSPRSTVLLSHTCSIYEEVKLSGSS